jgi:hypothetical protein
MAITSRGDVLLTTDDIRTGGSFSGRIIRYVRSAEPGCVLTRDTTFEAQSGRANWDAVAVDANGVLHAATVGPSRSFLRAAPTLATCAGTAIGFTGQGGIGVFADGKIRTTRVGASVQAIDMANCSATTESVFRPSSVHIAPIGSDAAVVYDSGECRIGRYRDNQELWCSNTVPSIPNRIMRCADDLCITQGGTNSILRVSGDDGSVVTSYGTTTLFGLQRVTAAATSPDGAFMVVANAVAADPEVCGANTVEVWVVTGF